MGKDHLFFGRRVLEVALLNQLEPKAVYVESREARHWAQSLLRSMGFGHVSIAEASRSMKYESSQGVYFDLEHSFYLSELPEDWVERYPHILFCNHLEDIQNLGALVRSAAAFDFKLLVHEERRSFRLNAQAVRISQGYAFAIDFFSQANLLGLLLSLQKHSYEVFALDGGADTISLYDVNPSERMCLIVGSEAAGISKPLLNKADYRLKIPMRDSVESLNAAQAGSIAMSYFYGR